MSDLHDAGGVVAGEHAGMRVDRYVAEVLALFSRSQLNRHDVTLTINDAPAKLSRALREGDRVHVTYRDLPEHTLEAEPIALDILYEDECVVVVNKPRGMVVHPAAGNWTGTLVQGLLHHVSELADEASRGSGRPGIVHRLDKDTSGVLVAAKNATCQEALARQFRKRTVEKLYLAVVRGAPGRSSGTVEASIARDPRNRKRFAVTSGGGRTAKTEYRVLKHFPGYAFVAVHPVTGRTHQIRVHMHHLGCPVLGDPVYGRKDRTFPEVGLMLHAYRLTFRLPATGERRSFVAPLPDRFRSALRALADLPSGTTASRRRSSSADRRTEE